MKKGYELHKREPKAKVERSSAGKSRIDFATGQGLTEQHLHGGSETYQDVHETSEDRLKRNMRFLRTPTYDATISADNPGTSSRRTEQDQWESANPEGTNQQVGHEQNNTSNQMGWRERLNERMWEWMLHTGWKERTLRFHSRTWNFMKELVWEQIERIERRDRIEQVIARTRERQEEHISQMELRLFHMHQHMTNARSTADIAREDQHRDEHAERMRIAAQRLEISSVPYPSLRVGDLSQEVQAQFKANENGTLREGYNIGIRGSNLIVEEWSHFRATVYQEIVSEHNLDFREGLMLSDILQGGTNYQIRSETRNSTRYQELINVVLIKWEKRSNTQ